MAQMVEPNRIGDGKIFMVTCRAPVNIAVIKYWGKRDEDLILPLNDSVSVTLSVNEMYAQTTVAVSKSFIKDRMWLNGKEVSCDTPRIQNCLREIRRRARKRKAKYYDGSDDTQIEDILNWHVHISSMNNFPTAAGLASSAAGYACLVYSLAKLYNIDMEISEIARQGSGSACRSVYGGFVQWLSGSATDGSDSISKQILPASYWSELHILILVVNDKQKAVSSTSGMQQSVKTSELLQHRINVSLPERIPALLEAIEKRDFERFSQITMQDSNQFHAICLDTFPPIKYLNDISYQIMQLVHQYNRFCNKNMIAYSFDAGPNAFLFLLDSTIPVAAALIEHYFPNSKQDYFRGVPVDNGIVVTKEMEKAINLEPRPDAIKYVIHTKVGDGPQMLHDSFHHLLNEEGMPTEKEET